MSLCLKGFDNCLCVECKLIKSYRQTENKLSEININYNRLGDLYHKQLENINQNKKYSEKLKHDNFTKFTFNKMEELNKKANKLIYKLNSLEKKADLIGVKLNC